MYLLPVNSASQGTSVFTRAHATGFKWDDFDSVFVV